MRSTTGWIIAAVVAALTLAPLTTQAQTVTTAVTLTIPPILYISGDGTSIGFPTPSDADYQAGRISSNTGPTLTHRGNVNYGITIQAQSGSYLAFTADAGFPSTPDPHKPFSELTLTATTGGVTTPPVALGAPLSPNTLYVRGAKGGTMTSVVSAQMALSYDKDPPGRYSTTVVFTIVAQ